MKTTWIKKLFCPNWQIVTVLEVEWFNHRLEEKYTVYGYIYHSTIRNKYKYEIEGSHTGKDYRDMEASCLKFIAKQQPK